MPRSRESRSLRLWVTRVQVYDPAARRWGGPERGGDSGSRSGPRSEVPIKSQTVESPIADRLAAPKKAAALSLYWNYAVQGIWRHTGLMRVMSLFSKLGL